MSQISKVVSLDISVVSIFIQFVCPCLRSVLIFMQRDSFTRCIGSAVLLSVTVVLSIGYGGLAPMHI